MQRVAVPAQPVQQRLLRQDRQRHLDVGRTVGRCHRFDGPRSPPKPPSPRAKIDRLGWSTTACRQSVTVVWLTMTAAVPLSQISVNRVTERAEPLAGNGPGTVTPSLACSTLLSSMSMPGNLTFGGLVMVEAGRHVCEGGQHLRDVVGQVAQLARIHRVRAGAQPEVVELDIATAPREFDGLQLGAQRDVEIDRHVAFPGVRCRRLGGSGDVQCGQVSERHGRADGAAGPGVGVAHHRGADIARGIEAFDHAAVVAQRAGVHIGAHSALGAQVAGHHLDRVIRRVG